MGRRSTDQLQLPGASRDQPYWQRERERRFRPSDVRLLLAPSSRRRKLLLASTGLADPAQGPLELPIPQREKAAILLLPVGPKSLVPFGRKVTARESPAGTSKHLLGTCAVAHGCLAQQRERGLFLLEALGVPQRAFRSGELPCPPRLVRKAILLPLALAHGLLSLACVAAATIYLLLADARRRAGSP
jgi:hypothetical protein